MPLDVHIEALLFFKGEPISIKNIAELLETQEESVISALSVLKEKLKERGLTLIEKEGEVTLATSPSVSDTISRISKDELERDLGKASLETLSIILYRGPLKRSEIDYIRGVNSNFILRNLLIRGLVEKTESKNDKRVFEYKATLELLAHLGISTIEELPEYATVRDEIEQFKKKKDEEDTVVETEHE